MNIVAGIECSCLVSVLEVQVAGFGVVAEVDPLPVVSDDVLGSRVLVVASFDQLQHPRGEKNTLGTLLNPRDITVIHKI